MTPTPPRARIQRLEQSLAQSRPSATPRRSGRRTVQRSSATSRAYDTGQPPALYRVRPAATEAGTATERDAQPEPQVDGVDATVSGVVTRDGTGTLPAESTPTTTPPSGSAPDAAGSPAAHAAPRPNGPTEVSPGDTGAPPSAAAGGDTGGQAGMDGWRTAGDPADGDEAFAQDIQAIIAHAQSVSGPSQAHVPLPTGAVQGPDQPAQSSRTPAGPPPGVGSSATHDVFEAMAVANAPSRFAQGPVALSVDFDRLDRALGDVAPAATPAVGTPVPAEEPPAAPAAPSEEPPAGSVVPAPDGGVTDVADVAAITSGSGPFRVTTDAQLVPQVPGLSCHAAACATLVAWRDEMPPDAAAVAGGTGYWERYADGRTAVHPDVFETFGLATASAGHPPSPAALRDLLDTQGPLFVTASPPGEHAVVVSGITGDGTTSGTILDVVDPWAEGMTTFAAPNQGSTYSVPVATLLERVGTGPDHQILVAHLRKGMS